MRKGDLDQRYLIAIVSMILTFTFFNLTWAAPPKIYSIVPDSGINTEPTQVTIIGADFEQTLTKTPKVALYGGGPYITHSYDIPFRSIYVTSTYAYMTLNMGGVLSALIVTGISDPNNLSIVGFCDYARPCPEHLSHRHLCLCG